MHLYASGDQARGIFTILGYPFRYLFPSVGGTRRATCLIEDVAFHIEDLPRQPLRLRQLIARHGYEDACIWLCVEGNYHFILNQSFGSDAEVKRYEADERCQNIGGGQIRWFSEGGTWYRTHNTIPLFVTNGETPPQSNESR